MDLNTVPPRFDIYAFIHKALRACLCHTLAAVGNADEGDEQEIAGALAQARELAALFESHVAHENAFVHPAMEARRPGSSMRTRDDHFHHHQAIAQIGALADDVERSTGDARRLALTRLYRHLAIFTAENLAHMDVEETENNAVLWSAYTDAELLALDRAIQQTIPPAEMASFMRWMIPAVNAGERALIFNDVRSQAPAPVFDGMLGLAQAHLAAADFAKLKRSLDLPARLAA